MEKEVRKKRENKSKSSTEKVQGTEKVISNWKDPSLKTLSIVRTFNAPREAVWRAWTDPEAFRKWLGPKGYTAPFSKIDLRRGGKYLNCMRSPEGKDFWSTGTYTEIKEPEKIVCTDSFADDYGNLVHGSYYGLKENFPLELQVTLIFEEENDKTKFTLIHEGHPEDMVDDARLGWEQSFDKLDEYLNELKRKPLSIF